MSNPATSWCVLAGNPKCADCNRGMPRWCKDMPAAPKGLSYAIDEALRDVGHDWGRPPFMASYPTIKALIKRGLIEMRGSYYGGTSEVRRVLNSNERDACTSAVGREQNHA